MSLPQTCNHVVIFGASGDLAKKKIYPALFSLYHERLLPQNTKVIGYARTPLTTKEFHDRIVPSLKCRLKTPTTESCDMNALYFQDECTYVHGDYTMYDMQLLQRILSVDELTFGINNRIFYMSLPPSMYLQVAENMSILYSKKGWNRVIMEKPFGRDAASSRILSECINKYIAERDIYRIDHYLGKELVENITTLRFKNAIFKAIWSREHIESVHIQCWETIGIENRGYFDEYGITRDIIQNHLFQILALIAMEDPELTSIRDEKVRVLKSVLPVRPEDVVFGQYDSYLQNDCVKPSSTTETYARMKLYINNARWTGIPFTVEAGKGMSEKKVEIRIVLKSTPNVLQNELVLRVQPNEGIMLKINSKIPGFQRDAGTDTLNLSYESHIIPDAYEKLLLDAFNGNQDMFISNGELEASWIALDDILQGNIIPKPYIFGSQGPSI